MKLIDKAVRAFALRWLKGRVDSARKGDSGMGKVLKVLDGWRLLIGVTILFLVGVWDAYHNGHAGNLVGSVLSVLGWLPGAQDGFTASGITGAAGSAVALIGFFGRLWKANQQLRAGATLSEVNSPAGVVKAAAKDGSLRALDVNPAVLEIAGAVVLAKPVK
jgi:hypothetical protein